MALCSSSNRRNLFPLLLLSGDGLSLNNYARYTNAPGDALRWHYNLAEPTVQAAESGASDALHEPVLANQPKRTHPEYKQFDCQSEPNDE